MQLLKNLIERSKGIILNPRFEWELIETETVSISGLYKHYIMPLAAIDPIASVIGVSFVGFNIPFFGHHYIPLAYSLSQAILCYVLSLLGVYFVALIINFVARRFEGEADFIQALKLVAYSSTPMWILGIFSLIPSFYSISFLGFFYGIYLVYLGFPVLIKFPLEKRVWFVLVVAVFWLLVILVISFVRSLFFATFSPSVGGVG